MERRAYAMFKKQWSDKVISVTSPQIDLENYLKKVQVDNSEVINLIVGDLQRVLIFPKKDYSIAYKVPKKVMKAFDSLVAMGFTKHLLRDY